MAFVLDNSVAIAWFVDSQATAYLELAQRLGLPLAAQDAVLRAAARRAGVPVL